MLLSKGERTPPTQGVTSFRIAVPGWNGVSNHDSVRVHEDFFHEQSDDSLSFLDRTGFSPNTEPLKKLLEALRERKVCFLIKRFCFKRIELCTKRGLLLAKLGHSGSELVERHQSNDHQRIDARKPMANTMPTPHACNPWLTAA